MRVREIQRDRLGETEDSKRERGGGEEQKTGEKKREGVIGRERGSGGRGEREGVGGLGGWGGESSAESALLQVNTLLAQHGAEAGTEVPRADPPHTLSRLKSPSLLLFASGSSS